MTSNTDGGGADVYQVLAQEEFTLRRCLKRSILSLQIASCKELLRQTTITNNVAAWSSATAASTVVHWFAVILIDSQNFSERSAMLRCIRSSRLMNTPPLKKA